MDATKLFERGKEAFERGSWELAIVIWQQLLAVKPDHLDARKLLREAENRKWTQANSGSGAKILALVRGIGPLVCFAVHMLTKKYDRAVIDCEKFLIRDPNCMPVLWWLAAAALKGGQENVAILTLEYMRGRNPKNVKVLRRLGRLYEDTDDINRAIDAWEGLKNILPVDREAQTQLRDLAAKKTMVDGKYDTAGDEDATYRQSLKNKDDSEELEQEHRIIRTDEDLQRTIDRVTKDVENEPENKRHLLQLGDLYRRAQNPAKARELYERAQKLDSMDFSIPERLGELKIDEYAEREKALAQKVAASPGDTEAKARLAALKKEKFDFSLKEYERQVHVRPTDAELRKKLGDLYYEAKLFDQAAPEYQRAASDPRMRRECRKLLGLCLYNTGKHQLAASQFEQAIEGGNAASREVRDVMYYLAVTLEKLGHADRAVEVLRKIFDVDMSYKDVQERLDRLMRVKEDETKAPEPEGEHS